jgi:hypothetical protein
LEKNNSLTRVFNTRVQLDTRIKYTRSITTRVQLLKFYLIKKKIIFEKKNNSLTRVLNTRVQLLKFYLIKKKLYLEKNNSLTRVLNTRVQLDMRIKYTRPIRHAY